MARSSKRQLFESALVFQSERVEPFRKPAVDRSDQFASLLRLALIAPEPRATVAIPPRSVTFLH
jgi:hypothetical protein